VTRSSFQDSNDVITGFLLTKSQKINFKQKKKEINESVVDDTIQTMQRQHYTATVMAATYHGPPRREKIALRKCISVSYLILLAIPMYTMSFVAPSKSHRCRCTPFTPNHHLPLKMGPVPVIQSDIVDAVKTIQPITERTRFQGALAIAAIATVANNGLEFNTVPVAESLLALAASLVVVAGATDAVERITSSQVPPYDPNSQRFDQTNFGGRFYRMLLECDPRLLLYTQDEVRQYHALANNHKTVAPGNPKMDRMLWQAKRIADSALHPETGEWIPRPFRMSGYLPFNGPICVAMVASQSTLLLLLWSWLNQSQNALVNYYNRNASSRMSNTTLCKSYAVAVASALAVSFLLATLVQSHYSGEEAEELLRFISFPSAVIASSLNCFIVRRPEIDSGVILLNKQMENVLPGETSREAAKRGVYSTTASRAILQMPTYFIPPLILDTVEPIKHYMCENPTTVVPITTFLLLVSFGVGLPCAVGMFPQMSKIRAIDVESKFRDLGPDEFYFNKGL
jgi:hypothetical protein